MGYNFFYFSCSVTVMSNGGVLFKVFIPHNNVKKFNECFSKSLTLLNQMNTNCYLCGDYNIDLLGAGKKAYVDEYLNSLYANGFCSLINKPTRYSRTSATILDHIFTKKYVTNLNCTTGIIKLDISDHLPTFCTVKCKVDKSNVKPRFSRDTKLFNFENFYEDISASLHNSLIIPEDNPNEALDKLVRMIKNKIDKHAPLKRLSRQQMKIKTKPWLTFGIIKSIKTKNKLFKLSYKQNKPNLVNKYKEYLKVLKQTIKKAKQSYYYEEIVKHKNIFQKQWGIINEILGRNKKNKCQIHEINDINNNQKLTEDYAIIFINFSQKLELTWIPKLVHLLKTSE